MDSEGNVFPFTGASDNNDRRLIENGGDISTRFTFTMAGNGAVGAFVLMSPDHGSYIYSDPSSGTLKALTPPDSSNSEAAPLDLVMDGYATLFTAEQVSSLSLPPPPPSSSLHKC